MSLSSLQFVFVNTTSVENLSRKVKVWTVAVYIPRPELLTGREPFQTITYPLSTSSKEATSTGPTRTFAILHSKPGENIYDLGAWRNFKNIMGNTLFDILVPLRFSPFVYDRENEESDFPLGPVVQRLREEAGITQSRSDGHISRRRKRRRSRPSAVDGKKSRRPKEKGLEASMLPSSEPISSGSKSSPSTSGNSNIPSTLPPDEIRHDNETEAGSAI
jgi:hypothetical protein